MADKQPETKVDPRFSDPNAPATPWSEASKLLEEAKIYWLTTVRPDSRPHVTPLFAVWTDDAFWFATGATERKAKNMAENAHCVVTTGCNTIDGVDIILEGDTETVTAESALQAIADKFQTKYDWHYEVRDGAFYHDEGGRAEVYRIIPAVAFGFAKGGTFSQTRWTF